MIYLSEDIIHVLNSLRCVKSDVVYPVVEASENPLQKIRSYVLLVFTLLLLLWSILCVIKIVDLAWIHKLNTNMRVIPNNWPFLCRCGKTSTGKVFNTGVRREVLHIYNIILLTILATQNDHTKPQPPHMHIHTRN